MMPAPSDLGALIGSAERIACGGRLDRLSALERRRLLAWAVLEQLRRRRWEPPDAWDDGPPGWPGGELAALADAR